MTRRRGAWLRGVVLALVLAGLVLPILIGAGLMTCAAFGVMPALGAGGATLDPWRTLFAAPGVAAAIALTVWTGLAATLLSLALAVLLVAGLHSRLPARVWAAALAPLLAAPHAAVAIGLAFLIAPSGWIARGLSRWATGWHVPPAIVTVNDPFGFAMIGGLALKEVPFLALILLAALGRIPLRQTLAAGRSMGYLPSRLWPTLVLPQVWPLIRLPVYAVLSFSLSVVDVALILGPATPPPLAVQMTRWFLSPETGAILPASAAALLQAALVIAGIGLLRAGEIAAGRLLRRSVRRGGRGSPFLGAMMRGGAVSTGAVLAGIGFLSLAALAVWSFAWRWQFPDALPERWSLRAWATAGPGLRDATLTTLLIGLAATALSLALAIAWLEGEDRGRLKRAQPAEALVYLPLVLPQVAFLPGLYMVFLGLGVPTGVGAVIWAQMLFVFPYVLLALTDPWRALDQRLLNAAAALGAGPSRRLFSVKLPLLAVPVVTAAAIGFAVSVAQYLPTLFLGAGRVATLTTEAVALSSGSDRRVAGAYGLLVAMLPLVGYALALLVPAALYRNRRGMLHGPTG